VSIICLAIVWANFWFG